MDSMYIKAGDTIALKHRLSGNGIDVVACSSSDNQCALKPDCIVGLGDGNKFGEDNLCPDDVFVVGALGKSAGDQIVHKDSLSFSLPTPPESTSQFWLRCGIDEMDTEGECSKLECKQNNVVRGSSQESINECDQPVPFTFQLTKL